MIVRRATPEDAPCLLRLFYGTVHAVNSRDYSQEQVDAWAPPDMSKENWRRRQETRTTFVAEQDGQIVGFAELGPDGHIDGFYTHKDHQGQGAGTRLLEAIVAEAAQAGVQRLFAEVSITARPFFERRGFRVVRPQEFEHRGVMFRNYIMERLLI